MRFILIFFAALFFSCSPLKQPNIKKIGYQLLHFHLSQQSLNKDIYLQSEFIKDSTTIARFINHAKTGRYSNGKFCGDIEFLNEFSVPSSQLQFYSNEYEKTNQNSKYIIKKIDDLVLSKDSSINNYRSVLERFSNNKERLEYFKKVLWEKENNLELESVSFPIFSKNLNNGLILHYQKIPKLYVYEKSKDRWALKFKMVFDSGFDYYE